MPVFADRAIALVIGHDEDDVGASCPRRLRRQETRGKTENKKEAHDGVGVG
jgi:hypothetical protein